MEQHALFVFDLDGVITNPTDSSVDHVTIEHIYKLLEDGTYVAINTGRPYAWVQTNLLGTLESMGGHAMFDHLYIVCEKGGESLVWSDGDFRPQPSRFALSEESMTACKRFFDDNAEDFNTMFWDNDKLTMATIEKRPEADLGEFKKQQQDLAERLRKLFDGQEVRIDTTTIATDVELPSAGKHAGAELVYEWTRQHHDAEHAAFMCFGDSKSDYEMARYFADQGNVATFIFVGKKEDTFEEHEGVTLVRTNALYAAGTREFLGE